MLVLMLTVMQRMRLPVLVIRHMHVDRSVPVAMDMEDLAIPITSGTGLSRSAVNAYSGLINSGMQHMTYTQRYNMRRRNMHTHRHSNMRQQQQDTAHNNIHHRGHAYVRS